MQFLSLYLHIPFCRHRCSYCAFNIYTDQADSIPLYITALCQEIALVGHGQTIKTIYLGGGTPSLLPIPEITRLMVAVRQAFDLSACVEITMEINPEGVTEAYLAALRELGINRLSIGMQSAQTGELRLFERDHTLDTQHVITLARQVGFQNISLDLIYGVPTQTLVDWQNSLETALSFNPQHFSLYSLQVESGTQLARQIKQGLYPAPDDDLTADMYDWAVDCLAKANFDHYEISSWAKAGFESQHNLQYWYNEPYLGLGAGAHGYLGNIRTVNAMRPEVYAKRINAQTDLPYPCTGATQHHEVISPQDERFETIMVGLRLLKEGFSKQAYQNRFHEPIEARYGEVIQNLKKRHLLLESGEHLFLPPHAWLIANSILSEFILD